MRISAPMGGDFPRCGGNDGANGPDDDDALSSSTTRAVAPVATVTAETMK